MGAIKTTRKPTAQQVTVELELVQDEHYPDYYAVMMNTGEGTGKRIAGGKASGNWKILRRWTAKFTKEDLKQAISFSKKKKA